MFRLLLFLFTFTSSTYAQDTADTTISIRGVVIDIDKDSPLAYTNIYVLRTGKGVISNEKGFFSLDVSDLKTTDSIRFQFIGYSAQTFVLSQLDTLTGVYLKEKIINLGETLIFGNAPDPKSIVKKVLENKEQNYKTNTTKKNVFIRKRYVDDTEKFELKLKKSSIPFVDEELIKKAQENIAKASSYYTDYLGDIYTSGNKSDSINFKLNPVRIVSLKQEDSSELDKLDSLLTNMFKDTKENEYWRIKSGVIGTKIKLDRQDDESENPQNDTLKNLKTLSYYTSEYKRQLQYTSLNDDKDWEFLHKTSKYDYVLTGGTSVNGEDVYIIDFMPSGSGNFQGRMFISIETNALIRADYEYAEGKSGIDVQLMGVGYAENKFNGSIYFEKSDSTYAVKYFSKKTGASTSFERSISLVKKRKRFLFNKKLNQIKVMIETSQDWEYSFEYLVIDEQQISDAKFSAFKQPQKAQIIYVEQFDEKLWKGYSIIEPTQQMKEYKKQ